MLLLPMYQNRESDIDCQFETDKVNKDINGN